MPDTTETLRICPIEDIPKLIKVIKKKWPYGLVACNYLHNVINWQKKSPNSNYQTLMVPKEGLESGTFVCLMQFSSYDLFVFTLEESCEILYKSLAGTKLIDWTRNIMYPAICDDHVPAVRKAMAAVNANICFTMHNEALIKEKEKSLHDKIECPPEIYVDFLTKDHLSLVNGLWPHRWATSEEYVWTMMNLNYAIGFFLKENNQLVAWILKNQMGCLGLLQVVDECSRRGYGSLVTRCMNKKLAEEGIDAVGFIVKSNGPSMELFAKLGFRRLYSVTYIYVNHEPDHVPHHALPKL